ncbi:MAG TPA: DUF2007 domain-containing protein [Thermoanaerobaculia bacterium]|nr:DUF2007 domain-containing protein [Thermoanaerobaculia bacterium]
MSDDLVTIDRFLFIADAEIARGALEAAGIDAVLADENVVRMSWGEAQAHGGVRLQVRRSDAPAAAEILASENLRGVEVEEDHEVVPAPREASCARCGSEEIYPARSRAKTFWRWMLISMGSLMLLNAAMCSAAIAGIDVPERLQTTLFSIAPLSIVVGMLAALIPPKMRCRSCGLES